jgi:hypothetical protein
MFQEDRYSGEEGKQEIWDNKSPDAAAKLSRSAPIFSENQNQSINQSQNVPKNIS